MTRPDISAELARDLIAAQFADWVQLPISPVPSSGTDNAMFRLGEDMAIRLPRYAECAPQILKEWAWLSRLAPLPLEVPEPLALGQPCALYPWHWSVQRWIEGEQATRDGLGDLAEAAQTIAVFLKALQGKDVTGGPRSSQDNYLRGGHLLARDEATRDALVDIADVFPQAETAPVWETALDAHWNEADAVWIHADLHLDNMLMREGQLSAVIDFGLMAVGDAACDLMIAYTLFEGGSRDVFRQQMGGDAALWRRARGWTLSVAARALAFYRGKNAYLADMSERAIAAVVDEYRS